MARNDTADIPIRASKVPSPGAAAFTLTINFDKDVIEIVDVLPGDAPFGGLVTSNIADGVVLISDLHVQEGKTGDFFLAEIRVKAIGSLGNFTNLSLTINAFKDPGANNIPVIAVDGRVEIFQ